MRRFLFMGGSGLLALNWIFKIKHTYDVYFVLHKRLVHIENTQSFVADLSDTFEVESIIKIVKPDIVVNTIALTDVDLCEKEPFLAKNINRNIWSSNYKIEKTLNKKLKFNIQIGLKKTINNFIKK